MTEWTGTPRGRTATMTAEGRTATMTWAAEAKVTTWTATLGERTTTGTLRTLDGVGRVAQVRAQAAARVLLRQAETAALLGTEPVMEWAV